MSENEARARELLRAFVNEPHTPNEHVRMELAVAGLAAALDAAEKRGFARGCDESRAVVKDALAESSTAIISEGKAAITEAYSVGRAEERALVIKYLRGMLGFTCLDHSAKVAFEIGADDIERGLHTKKMGVVLP